jgi:peptidoglycan/xylan/chitin deacetylase (PgdA/CDA1 family)
VIYPKPHAAARRAARRKDFSRRAAAGEDNRRIVNKRRRIVLVIVAGAVVAVAAWFTFRSREPEHQGKPLSWWLQQTRDLYVIPENAAFPTSAEMASRKQRIATALRQMGTNALPHLVRRLTQVEQPSPLRRLIEWINDHQSVLRLHTPESPDWSTYAAEAFHLLGPDAAPAIPALAPLLHSESTCPVATEALMVIGPNSLPTFVRALTNHSSRVRSHVLQALGDFGPAAAGAIPLIVEIARGTNTELSGKALRVLSEVDTNRVQYLPLLESRLFDTNHPLDAAFVLGRMGLAGVPLLARALANENRQVRIGALAALQPEISELGDVTAGTPAERGFSRLECVFNLKCLTAAWSMHERTESLLAPAAWARVAQHPDPAVQSLAVEQLAGLGLAGAVGLSFAAESTNITTRREARAALEKLELETYSGAITRGPKSARRLALVFTAHEFAEGGETILSELTRHRAKASFFLTGDFLRNTNFLPLIRRMVADGHLIGPHSDKHLLYCSWDADRRTLVTRGQFRQDLGNNFERIRQTIETSPLQGPPSAEPSPRTERYGGAVGQTEARLELPRYFLPAYEHYNRDVALWTREMGFTLINYTPGTRSNADYTGEADKNFVSSQTIFDSILKKEREDPHGLNGFILLLHLGSGPGRKDKFHHRFGELLDALAAKGYQFVRVDELLEPKPEKGQ